MLAAPYRCRDDADMVLYLTDVVKLQLLDEYWQQKEGLFASHLALSMVESRRCAKASVPPVRTLVDDWLSDERPL